jgi:hypothetical protein
MKFDFGYNRHNVLYYDCLASGPPLHASAPYGEEYPNEKNGVIMNFISRY